MMRKYFPSKTELQTLIIGFSLGVIGGAWFLDTFGLLVLIAPVIIVVSVCLYLYHKQKQQFEIDLLKAKVPQEITRDAK